MQATGLAVAQCPWLLYRYQTTTLEVGYCAASAAHGMLSLCSTEIFRSFRRFRLSQNGHRQDQAAAMTFLPLTASWTRRLVIITGELTSSGLTICRYKKQKGKLLIHFPGTAEVFGSLDKSQRLDEKGSIRLGDENFLDRSPGGAWAEENIKLHTLPYPARPREGVLGANI